MHNYVFILSTAHYNRLICGKGARFRAVLGQQRFAGPGIEYLPKNFIFGLKMIVKSGLGIELKRHVR